jgi:hypothetical protein
MLVLDIIVSGFAAFGVFCAAKFMADGFITPASARPRPSVRLTGKETPREIEELCENAKKAIICNRGEVVLILPDGDGRSEELEALGLHDVKIVYEK